MILNRDLQKDDFEKVVSGQRAFVSSFDECITAKIGDYVACNEWEHGYTGRCCLVKVTDVLEMEDATIYAVNPCRIDEHVRLTTEVYGEKVNNSKGVVGMLQSNKCRREEGGSDDT